MDTDARCMKAIIFDLDNCLSPAAEPGAEFLASAMAAIREANDGSLAEDALQAAFSDMWWHAFDWVADKYAFTPAMIDAGWKALASAEIAGRMHGYQDLPLLQSVPGERFLVTSGFRRLQESKIRALGIAPHFSGVFVDAIDAPVRQGKRRIFEEILAKHRLAVPDVVVVGDNPESELAAARSLGLIAVQILRPGVVRSDVAMHHVTDLPGLISWLHEV